MDINNLIDISYNFKTFYFQIKNIVSLLLIEFKKIWFVICQVKTSKQIMVTDLFEYHIFA